MKRFITHWSWQFYVTFYRCLFYGNATSVAESKKPSSFIETFSRCIINCPSKPPQIGNTFHEIQFGMCATDNQRDSRELYCFVVNKIGIHMRNNMVDRNEWETRCHSNGFC